MSYEKQNFKDGGVLTAEHLNHMEEGIINAQADWNANEGEAGYIANKPFYKETQERYNGKPVFDGNMEGSVFCTEGIDVALKAGIRYSFFIENADGSETKKNIEAVYQNGDTSRIVCEFENEELGFLLLYEPDYQSTTFYARGTRWMEGRAEVGTPYVSKYNLRICYQYEADVGYVTLDPNFLPKAEAVADVTAAPTAEQFNALLTALRNAGYMEN